MQVESIPSGPPIMSVSRPQSIVQRPRMPTVSMEEVIEISPYRETIPYEGLYPVIPQKAAGWRMEPPVSEPNAAAARPRETAHADPPELPPVESFTVRRKRSIPFYGLPLSLQGLIEGP